MNNNARAILDALTELIETLWNVNVKGKDGNVVVLRINRNIVECKCH